MDEFRSNIIDNIDAAAGLAREGLCDRCLGRMFGKVGTGTTNNLRGIEIREILSERGIDAPPADPCPLCENVFDLLDRFADAAAEKVNDVESDNFLIGTRVEPEIAAKEKDLVERHGPTSSESIKAELNREIGKVAIHKINRPVEFKNPQVVACVDTRFADVSLDIAPIFIAGRYNKFSREIPQTIWPCRECHGKGCARCGGQGKMYSTSVQEVIGDVALEMSHGEEHFFHGMGREDIDACMLGDGRPFVLEISKPRKRGIDLDELEKRANASDLAAYSALHFVSREAVQIYKGSDPDKTYKARVRAQGKVNKERVNEVALSFKNVQIDQRTPQRVEHRRADLVRKRGIRWVKAEVVGDDVFDLTLSTESGTYVKEFVSGDEGRTSPNFSDALGVRCVVETLDVLSIDYQEPTRD
ncbi:MAG: tRNA pseudouridine(54/55) synthase Pus10 [Candidatus Methanoplasma sp.]|jgi:tRNA pseudouridine synthase 10|nr:tRNA pseudouridine(54/55) synthase Pus10 [Candidatus Methanoplasma sp.]